MGAPAHITCSADAAHPGTYRARLTGAETSIAQLYWKTESAYITALHKHVMHLNKHLDSSVFRST